MHIASVNVRFYETDMMGIAHHSKPILDGLKWRALNSFVRSVSLCGI